MWELVALIVYSVQWLGIVLGVGAEAVVLVAHLLALHERKPQWLDAMPAVRAVQRWGLALIILSGICAAAFQFLIDPSIFALPVFGFKWLLIALAWITFIASHRSKSSWLEGFSGGTWLALFVVHSVAPSGATWPILGGGYLIWLLAFGLLWVSSMAVMSRGAARALRAPTTPAPTPPAPAPKVVHVPVAIPKPAPAAVIKPMSPPLPKPVVQAPSPPPPAPKPAPIAPPKPIVPPPVAPKPIAPIVPTPLIVHAPEPITKKAPEPVIITSTKPTVSLWKRFVAFFASKPAMPHAPAQPKPAALVPATTAHIPVPIKTQAPKPHVVALVAPKAAAHAPEPVTKNVPVPVVIIPAMPKVSLWKRLMALFAHTPKAKPIVVPVPEPVIIPSAKPTMGAASAPLPLAAVARVAPRTDVAPDIPSAAVAYAPKSLAGTPAPAISSNLPVVEHLELMSPAQAPAAVPLEPHEPAYIPDWNNLPGVRIMPQKPEDVSKENRAPLVQSA